MSIASEYVGWRSRGGNTSFWRESWAAGMTKRRTIPPLASPTVRCCITESMERPCLYYHCRNAEHVVYDNVTGFSVSESWPEAEKGEAPSLDWDMDNAFHMQQMYDVSYRWLAAKTGFWPLFMSVGREDATITGYQWQWGPHHAIQHGGKYLSETG